MAEVFPDGEALVQRGRLEHDAEQAAHGRPVGPHIGAEHADAAGRRTHERRDDSEQRRLAAAVRPEQREHLSGAHRQAHVVERDAIAVRVADVLDLERRRSGAERAGRARQCQVRSASISTQSTGRYSSDAMNRRRAWVAVRCRAKRIASARMPRPSTSAPAR